MNHILKLLLITLLLSVSLQSKEVDIESKITSLYVSFFNRAPDERGLTYWSYLGEAAQERGESSIGTLKDLAAGFATHPTFSSTYDSMSNLDFVHAIYENSLGKEGDIEGVVYWTGLLNNGMSRSDMVAEFMEASLTTDLTAENYPSLSSEDLAAAQERQNLISNKVEVAVYFTNTLGNNTNIEDSQNPENDSAYLASIEVIGDVGTGSATVTSAKYKIGQIKDEENPIDSIVNGWDSIGEVVTTELKTYTQKGATLEIHINNVVNIKEGKNPIEGFEAVSFYVGDTEVETDISSATSYHHVVTLIKERLSNLGISTVFTSTSGSEMAIFSIDIYSNGIFYSAGTYAGTFSPILLINYGPEELRQGDFTILESETSYELNAMQGSTAPYTVAPYTIEVEIPKESEVFTGAFTRSQLDTLIQNYTNSPTTANANAIIEADTSEITDMSNLFEYNSYFNLDISVWDTSNVTDMSSMFNNASSFNQNIRDWDVSNVTNMENMFQNAVAFNNGGDTLRTWASAVSNVTDMSGMFANADSFNADIENWYTPNVTDMEKMFYFNDAFNQDISDWTVDNVIYADGFADHSSLTNYHQPAFKE